jgi:hypothetical protein
MGATGAVAEPKTCDIAKIVALLSTLELLWPEELARIAGQSQGGTSASALCVEKRLLLAACGGGPYFAARFNRLKAGQRSAYSELVIGEALRALGYAFHFEAGDGQPDLVGTISGQIDKSPAAPALFQGNP